MDVNIIHMVFIVCIGTALAKKDNKGHQFFAHSNVKGRCVPLNDHINCFELIKIDKIVKSNNYISLGFVVFGDKVTLILSEMNTVSDKHPSVLSSAAYVADVKSFTTNTTFLHLNNYFIGYIDGIELTSAHGYFDGKVFQGVVRTKTTNVYFEPALNFFQNSSVHHETPILVYRESDVKYSSIKESRLKNVDVAKRPLNISYFAVNTFSYKAHTLDLAFMDIGTDYFKRPKRNIFLPNLRKTCTLHVVIDHTFYETIARSNRNIAIAEVIYHITEADSIFRSTDFDGDGYADNVGFVITNVTIYSDANAANYHMRSTTDTVDVVLDRLSRYDFDHVCLAILFTHREYSDGVIGLAWIASSSLSDYPGGLCQQRVHYNDGSFNFNTLLVSSLNFGSIVPRRIVSLTVTHELGHSFGSGHDPADSSFCAPVGSTGHFLMHEFSIDADKPNNDDFSPCSRMSIAPVIANKGVMCLQVTEGLVCGNEVAEEGEECDCGYSFRCNLVDQCCTPAFYNSTSSEGCTLRNEPGVLCSPSVSECCAANCTIESTGVICRDATECSEAAYCDGRNSDCPMAPHLPDDSPCQSSQRLCRAGECAVSLCTVHGYRDCQCLGAPDERCLFCCQSGTDSASCVPAAQLGIFDQSGSSIHLEYGQSCLNYTGYCNHDRACVYATTIRILEKLDDLIKGSPFHRLRRIIQNYWYYVLMTVLAVIFVFSIVRTVFQVTDSGRFWTRRMHVLNQLQAQVEQECERTRQQLARLRAQAMHCEIVEAQGAADSTVAIGRLCTFFPTAERAEVIDTAAQCASEQAVVAALVAKGFPLRAFFDPHFQAKEAS